MVSVAQGPRLTPFPYLTSMAGFQVTSAARAEGSSVVLRPSGLDLNGAAGTSPGSLLALKSPRSLPGTPLVIGSAPAPVEQRQAGGGDLRVPLLGAQVRDNAAALIVGFLLAAAGLLGLAAMPERVIAHGPVARNVGGARLATLGVGLSLLAGVAAAYLIDRFG